MMTIRSIRAGFAALRATELGGLAGDAAYIAVWQGAVSVADLIVVALVAHTLGLAEYGRLALVMSFVILVGQFFDVRVGTAETTFGAARLASQDWSGAAGVFRLGYGIDAATGLIGFLVVACSAPLVGPALIGSGSTQLMLLYGVTLLVMTVDDSSSTVVRLMGRFRLLAGYKALLEAFRVAAVAVALVVDQSLTAVLIALVAYHVVGACVNWLVASRVFSRASGRPLLRRAPERFSETRAMLRMVFHTNVVSYARIAQVQLPTLLLGALTSTTQVGLYKVGTAAAAIIARVVDPVYAALLPRLARLWAQNRRHDIARMLRDATPIAAAVVGGTLLLLVILREPALRLLGGAEAVAGAPVLVWVGIGYAVSGILFWNVSLLFAARRSGLVSLIALSSAAVQIALLVPLTIAFEATGAAAAMCASLVASNLVATVLALRALRGLPAGRGQSDSNTSDQRSTAILSEYEART
jgi:O-antigen/teichoic acid export membrane protein